MNKTILSLVLGILLINIVSASFITDIQDENVANLHLTISPHNTQANFLFNGEGKSWSNVNIPKETMQQLTGISSSMTLSVSELLNGINLQTNLNNGAKSPVFSGVSVSYPDSSIYKFILDYEMSQYGISEITSESLTSLAGQHPSPVARVGDAVFTKNGNDYTITYDKGFGDVPENYVTQIRELLKQYSNKTFNTEKIMSEYVLPNIPFEESLSSVLNLEQFNYDVVVPDLSAYSEFSADNLKDGTYEIPVTFKIGTESVQKIIYVTLTGIQQKQNYYRFADNACSLVNIFSSDKTENDYSSESSCKSKIQTTEDYTLPSTNSVSEWFNEIKNLPYGASPVFTVLDTETATNGTKMVSLHALKIIEITGVGNLTNGDATIYFSIDKNSVSNKNRIYLYVLEGTSWTKLDTDYLGISSDGTEYEYSAKTPHFSTFMIAEDTHHSGGGAGIDDGINTGAFRMVSSSPAVSNNVTQLNNPITNQNENKNSFSSFLTGAVTGLTNFVKSGAGIATLLGMMIIVIGAIVFFTVRRR